MLNRWLRALQIYADRRMAVMVGLGFSSGLPLMLVGGTLSLWLDAAEVSYALIGVFSLVKTPYSFKWLWAPLIDRLRLPVLGRMGRRRSWALLTQIVLLVSLALMALINPAENPLFLATVAVVVVLASASQDVVLDAFRIESFDDEEQGAAAAIFVLGYRLGMLFSGAVALWLASFLSWQEVYLIMAAGALVGIFTILLAKEPCKDAEFHEIKVIGSRRERFIAFMQKAVIAPFADFVKRSDWKLILLFVFLYKMSDAYMGPMANVFYKAMGFSMIEIASVSKFFGMGATILGGIIGGIVVSRCGLFRSLWICGILQGVTTLVFVAQAYAGHNIWMLAGCITLDNISGGMSVAAFVAYLSSLCSVTYTATQYALLSSLMSLARDAVAATSGKMVELVGWPMFFSITSLMVIPGLLVLYLLQKRAVKNSDKP